MTRPDKETFDEHHQPGALPHGDVDEFVRRLEAGAAFNRVDLAAVQRRLSDLVDGTVDGTPAPKAASVTTPPKRS